MSLCALGAGTVVRNRVWQSEVSLWADVAKKNLEDYRVPYNLGTALLGEQRSEEAMRAFEQTLELRPGYYAAHNGIAMLLQSQGELDRAVAHYREALRSDGFLSAKNLLSDRAVTHANLATALGQRGDVDEAVEQLAAALRISPSYAQAQYLWGDLLMRQGELEPAVQHLSSAVELDASHAAARSDLGAALLDLNRTSEAEHQLQEALRWNPFDTQAHSAMALIEAQRGNQIPDADADAIMADAQAIIDVLVGP